MHTYVYYIKAPIYSVVRDRTRLNLKWEKNQIKEEAFQIKIYFKKNSNTSNIKIWLSNSLVALTVLKFNP